MTDTARPAPHLHHLRVQRTARYYTLGAAGPSTRIVWFVLHGYGQLAGEFIRYFAPLADDHVMVVAPEALNRFYLVPAESAPASDRAVGATWMTREDRECEIADYVEYLDALCDEVASSISGASPGPAPAPEIHIIGFSQGCATATRWLAHGRARVARLVLWGGLTPPDTDLSRGAAVLRGARVTFVLGTRDQYVTEEMFAAERARLDTAGVPFDAIRFEGGHSVKRSVIQQLDPAASSPAAGR